MIIDKLKHVILRQDGNVAVLAAFVLSALLGMTALVVDGGKVYAVKMHLQKTANATVLSGAQELLATEQNVRNVADHILQYHGETTSLVNMSVALKDRTTVVLKKDVAMGLAKVLGFAKVPVSVKATAKIEAMGAAKGAAPVGIDQSVQLNYGQEYRLKVDETEERNGNFGILDLGHNGNGSPPYENNLAKGYSGVLSVGDVIDMVPGNKVGKTVDGVNARINSSPYPPGDMSHHDDPRMLLVPVYTPYNYSGRGKVDQVQITGFAYFYLTQSSNGKEVTGIFIKRTGIGFTKPSAVDRGAYAIKLTE